MITRSQLLNLPQEIKDQIWDHAFGNVHIPLYIDSNLDCWHSYNEAAGCEACDAKSPEPPTYEESKNSARLSWARTQGPSIDEMISRPFTRYNDHLNALFTSKEVLRDGIKAFHSTLTMHIKSPEALALIRRSAPTSLRQGVTKLVLYIHFDHANHFLWTVRFFELQDAFPNLQYLDINYHMRPPISYDNLLDAIYLSIPIFGLTAPFNRPIHVLTEAHRTRSSTFQDDRSGRTIATTGPQLGTTIHTSYMHNGTLFEAHFLGAITTADAVDEHTSVIRSIFHDPTFLAAARMVIHSNLALIRQSVASSYPPYAYPTDLLDRGFQDVNYLPTLQHALLQIARRHEKPWFEKLQRRRVVELYMEHCGMSKEEAEALLARQMAAQPDGQGIDEFVETLMMQGDDMGDLAQALGSQNEPGDAGQEISAAWQAEQH